MSFWCRLFHKKVNETIYFNSTVLVVNEEYCPKCQPERANYIEAQRKIWADLERHEKLYGPTIHGATYYGDEVPGFMDKTEGPFWHTCPDGHRHLKAERCFRDGAGHEPTSEGVILMEGSVVLPIPETPTKIELSGRLERQP